MFRRRTFLKWIYVIIIGTGDLFLCVQPSCFSQAPDYSMEKYASLIEARTLEYLENVAEFTAQKKSTLYILQIKRGLSKFVEIANDLSVLDSIFVPAVTNIYLVGPPLAQHTESWIVELTQALFPYVNLFYFEWSEIGSLESHLLARFIVPLGEHLSQLIAKVDKYSPKQHNVIVGIGLGCHVANVAAQSPTTTTTTAGQIASRRSSSISADQIVTQAYYLDPQPPTDLDYLYRDRVAYVTRRAAQYVQLISTTGSYASGPIQLAASQTFVVNKGRLQPGCTKPGMTDEQRLRCSQFVAVDIFYTAIQRDIRDDKRQDIVGYFSYGKAGNFSLTYSDANSIC